MNKKQMIEDIITDNKTTTFQKVDKLLNLIDSKKVKSTKKSKTNIFTIAKKIYHNASFPILKNVLVKNKQLFATNLDQFVITNTDQKDGLYKIIGQELVKSTHNIDDYPPLPTIKTNIEFTIELTREIIKNLICCSYTKSDRFILTGINIQSKDKMLYACSTTGTILYCAPILSNSPNINITIPTEVFEILEITKANILKLVIGIDTKNDIINVNYNDMTIISKLINGEFPNYWKIANTAEGNNVFAYNTNKLLSVLKELKPYITKKEKTITLFKNKIEINYPEENIIKNIELNVTKIVDSNIIKNINFLNYFLIMPTKSEDRENKIISLDFNLIYNAIKNTTDSTVYIFYKDSESAIKIYTSNN